MWQNLTYPSRLAQISLPLMTLVLNTYLLYPILSPSYTTGIHFSKGVTDNVSAWKAGLGVIRLCTLGTRSAQKQRSVMLDKGPLNIRRNH